jgi:hypothetical protein
MFGKYSSEAVKGISVERTKKENRLLKGLGGEVISRERIFPVPYACFRQSILALPYLQHRRWRLASIWITA